MLEDQDFSDDQDRKGTMAQMSHFSIPYYFTIPNSEFRNLHYEFRNSELWSIYNMGKW